MDKNTFKKSIKNNYSVYRGGSSPKKRLTKDSLNAIAQPKLNVNRIPSGSVIVDNYTEGGFPRGFLIEVFSHEGVGKTTTMLSCARACIETVGRSFIYLDYEKGLSFETIMNMYIPFVFYDIENKHYVFVTYETTEEGELRAVTSEHKTIDELKDTPALWLYTPYFYEEGDELLDLLVPKIKPVGIVIDSLPKMRIRKYADASLEDVNPGAHGNYNSFFFSKYVDVASQYDLSMFIINQLRVTWNTNWGPKQYKSFSDGTIKYYAQFRFELKRGERLDGSYYDTVSNKQIDVTNRHEVKFVPKKSKLFLGRPCSYYIRYGDGVDNVRSVMEILISNDFIAQSGAWFSFSDEIVEFCGDEYALKTQGRDNVEQAITENGLFGPLYAFLVHKGILTDFSDLWEINPKNKKRFTKKKKKKKKKKDKPVESVTSKSDVDVDGVESGEETSDNSVSEKDDVSDKKVSDKKVSDKEVSDKKVSDKKEGK